MHVCPQVYHHAQTQSCSPAGLSMLSGVTRCWSITLSLNGTHYHGLPSQQKDAHTSSCCRPNHGWTKSSPLGCKNMQVSHLVDLSQSTKSLCRRVHQAHLD